MAYVTSEKSNVDQLIGGTAVAALTKNITLKGLSAEKELKRGAVLLSVKANTRLLMLHPQLRR